MSVFIPTTVIGIGTSGSKTVEWLSRLLYQEFGRDVPPIIRLVTLDTAREGSSRDDLTHAVEQLPIAVPQVNAAWEELNRMLSIERWFGAEAMRRVENTKTDAGAGGVRAIGRMCLWYNWKDTLFANRIEEIAKEPFSEENRTQAAKLLTRKLNVEAVHPSKPAEISGATDYISESEHHIYIVGSATGGTASGSLIDVAHAAAAKSVRGILPKVIILLTLPPETMTGNEGVGVNAAAALIDVIEMLLDPATIRKTVERYPDNQTPVSLTKPPATAVYLLGPSAPGSHGSEIVFECSSAKEIQDGLAMIGAYWLYLCLFGFGSDLSAREADYDERIDTGGDTKEYPDRRPSLRCFSLSGAARPVWLLAELVTRRMLEAFIPQWAGGEGGSISATHQAEWVREGRDWLDTQLDNQIEKLTRTLATEAGKQAASNGRPTAEDLPVTQAALANLRTLHATASGSAQENGAQLAQLAREKIAQYCNANFSLMAAQKFLEGVNDALEARRREWTDQGVDCSGRIPSPEGSDVLLQTVASGYVPSPPWWIGGPNKRELALEVNTDLCAWMAAYHVAPSVFGTAGTPGSPSVLGTVEELKRSVDRRRQALRVLQAKWQEREDAIVNLDALARGTVSLVWFHDGDRPAEAADRVRNQLIGDHGSQAEAELKSALGKLWEFLEMPVGGQVQHLLEEWTSGVIMLKVAKIVNVVPLHESTAAMIQPHLLLALNRFATSRRYFGPLSGVDVGAPLASYHMTRARDSAAGYTKIPGHPSLCGNLDLKYVEAFGFTLYDLDPFREWLPRLLSSPNVLEERDPYGGIRRYVQRLSETLLGFVRDILVTWDVSQQNPLPVGIWSELDQETPPFLKLVQDGATTSILIDLGTAPPLSLALDSSHAVALLSDNPGLVAELMRRISAGLRMSNRTKLRQRWDEVREALARLDSTRSLDLAGPLAFDYGINNRVGGLGHLVND